EITTSPKIETPVKSEVEKTPTPEITTSPKIETPIKSEVEKTPTPEITTSPIDKEEEKPQKTGLNRLRELGGYFDRKSLNRPEILTE
ncbi:MAG: hypothetical protein EAZ87_24780, partial [Nostocales cyanobacterium]